MSLAAAAWLLWIALTAAVTWPAFEWELNYLHGYAPHLFRTVVGLLIGLPVLLSAWHRVRRHLWKFEFITLGAIPLAACLVYEPRAAIMLAGLCLACYAAGRRLRKMLHLRAAGPVEDIAISTLSGLGILHVSLFWIGTFGGYYWFVCAALLASMLVAGWKEIPELWKAFGELNERWRSTLSLGGISGSVWSAFTFALLVAATAFALAPSVTFDVLRFHLPDVQYFALHHSLQPPAYEAYADYPQSVESVMTLGFEMAGQPGAQLIPCVYFALALITLFRVGRLCGLDRDQGLAGLLFTVSVPAIHWTGASGKNDFALVAFLLGTVLCYLRWQETRIFQWIILGTFFAVMAAGVKHIILFAAPPLAVLYVAAAWRQPDRTKAFLKLAAVVIAFGLVWYARTWLHTGHFLYPATAGSAVSSAVKLRSSVWRDFVLPYLRLPWDLHFHARGYFESVSDYSLGILLLIFAPLWLPGGTFARARFNQAARVCLAFSGAYLAYWAFTMPVIRYGITALSILFVLTGGLAVQLCRTMPGWIRILTLGITAYALVFASLGIAINEITAPQFSYFAFRIDKPEFLRQALPAYRAMEFLKTRARPEDHTLSVDNCALAYAPDQSGFSCILFDSRTWNNVRRTVFDPGYRFLMVPLSHADAVPEGWKSIYADNAFLVFEHK